MEASAGGRVLNSHAMGNPNARQEMRGERRRSIETRTSPRPEPSPATHRHAALAEELSLSGQTTQTLRHIEAQILTPHARRCGGSARAERAGMRPWTEPIPNANEPRARPGLCASSFLHPNDSEHRRA